MIGIFFIGSFTVLATAVGTSYAFAMSSCTSWFNRVREEERLRHFHEDVIYVETTIPFADPTPP
jgi:hypothetical protein